MKIFDCFMYFDEDIVLNLRLNYLKKYVDYFVIVESLFDHKGNKRKPHFNLKKFEKFKDKIIYILIDHEPKNIKKINKSDSKKLVLNKSIMNALRRENYQRNFIVNGLEKAKDQDWIIISDLDEIPNLQNNNLKKCNKKIVFFQQQMFYYKFNLRLKNFFWIGSKACKKKYLRSCQWLRNVKDKKYPLWRFDVIFSIKKYFDIEIFKDGGWHFSYIKSPKKIEEKLRSYMHHAEYEQNPLGEKKIKNLVNNRKAIYDLYADSKQSKFTGNNILERVDLNKLPNYLKKNNKLYDKWIEK